MIIILAGNDPAHSTGTKKGIKHKKTHYERVSNGRRHVAMLQSEPFCLWKLKRQWKPKQ